jgi:hypothetical protein
MLSEGDIDGRQQRRQTVVDHRPGAVGGLLGRLEQRNQGAVPVRGPFGQQLRGPEQRSDMDVVPARVHHRHLVAVGVGGPDGAGVMQPGRLEHGQRVHVRTQQHGRTLPISQDPDDAGPAYPVVHLKPGSAQPLHDFAGRGEFLMRQLGVLVQIAIEVLLPGPDLRQPGEYGIGDITCGGNAPSDCDR